MRWSSAGLGDYELGTVDSLDFNRGTKIVMRLRKDSIQFAREQEIEKIYFLID